MLQVGIAAGLPNNPDGRWMVTTSAAARLNATPADSVWVNSRVVVKSGCIPADGEERAAIHRSMPNATLGPSAGVADPSLADGFSVGGEATASVPEPADGGCNSAETTALAA